MNFHVEMTLKAKQCQECKKYFKMKQESLMHLPNKHFIKSYVSCLWQQFQDEMLHTKTLPKKTPDIFVTKFNISVHTFYHAEKYYIYIHTTLRRNKTDILRRIYDA